MGAKWRNREKLLAKLKALPPEVRSAIRQAAAEGADDVVDMARRLVPKKTGKLAKSIVATFGEDSPKYSQFRSKIKGDPDLTVVVSAGNTEVRYAHLVEFGAAPHIAGGKFKGAQHPGSPAQPFFFPAFRANKKPITRRMNKAIKKAAQVVAQK